MIAKRAFDIILSLIGIIILIPVMLVTIFVIKFNDNGPVFFKQTRVGLNGKKFRIIKFRTMVVNAEKIGDKITSRNDKRVTKPGEWMRRYKLDELPQLYNVLVGEMSLVGPRPEVPEYVEHYPSGVRERILSVPPGITDIASILYKDESDLLTNAEDPVETYLEEILPVKLDYYLQYIKQRSLWLDMKIIVKTFVKILQ